MLYLTDLDYDAAAGHNIAEVEIYGTATGKKWKDILRELFKNQFKLIFTNVFLLRNFW